LKDVFTLFVFKCGGKEINYWRIAEYGITGIVRYDIQSNFLLPKSTRIEKGMKKETS